MIQQPKLCVTKVPSSVKACPFSFGSGLCGLTLWTTPYALNCDLKENGCSYLEVVGKENGGMDERYTVKFVVDKMPRASWECPFCCYDTDDDKMDREFCHLAPASEGKALCTFWKEEGCQRLTPIERKGNK